jgi:glycine cleavage system H lipoate-binding protein
MVAVAVALTVVTALLRSLNAIRGTHMEQLLWKAEFADLPLSARRCRHELNGEIEKRTCPSRFDCRTCAVHPTFPRSASILPPGESEQVMGVSLPLERYYHRGHTWARPEEDGTFTVGLDGIAKRVLGEPDRVSLPPVGAQVEANGTGWKLTKGKAVLRILSPIDGEVVAHGTAGEEWVLKVRPGSRPPVSDSLAHLLRGDEVRHWAMREAERLEGLLAPAGAGLSLADGGELIEDLPGRTPEEDWEGVLGSFFLQA